MELNMVNLLSTLSVYWSENVLTLSQNGNLPTGLELGRHAIWAVCLYYIRVNICHQQDRQKYIATGYRTCNLLSDC